MSLDVPLLDPAARIRRAIAVFVGTHVLVLLGGGLALGPAVFGGSVGDILLSGVLSILVGLALAKWAVPGGEVEIIFLRSFKGDRRRHDIRRLIEMTVHPIRLGGIKDPSRRLPHELRSIGAILSIAWHISNRYMTLEADSDWRARLVHSMARCRGVIIDLRDPTEFLREELELSLLQLGGSRVLLIVDSAREISWAEVAEMGPAQRVAIPDVSLASLATLSRRVAAFAAGLPPPSLQCSPMALARASGMTLENDVTLRRMDRLRSYRESIGTALVSVWVIYRSFPVFRAPEEVMASLTLIFSGFLAFVIFFSWVEGAARHRLRWGLGRAQQTWLMVPATDYLALGLYLTLAGVVAGYAHFILAQRPQNDLYFLTTTANAVVRHYEAIASSADGPCALGEVFSQMNLPWEAAKGCTSLTVAKQITISAAGPLVHVQLVESVGWLVDRYEIVVAPLEHGQTSPGFSCRVSSNVPASALRRLNCVAIRG